MKCKKTMIVGLLGLTLTTVSFVTACGKSGGGESIDPTKTQLYVNNFKRGFGGAWLEDYKTKFEALEAEKSYEEGKKGVQVIIQNSSSPAESRIANILDGRDEVFFTEQSSYFTLMQNDVLLDISDMVTEKLTEFGEDKSIEDKFTVDQINYLKQDGHYYAIPHYSGYFGLTYDVDLFAQKNLYLALHPTSSTGDGLFINPYNQEKSYGPDRKTGVIDGIDYSMDDGLPVTYTEFYELCRRMVKLSIIPMIAGGNTAGQYMNLLINQLSANNIGKDQMNIIFSCDGEMTNLGTVDANGNKSLLAPTTITPANGYLTYKNLGKYDALKFYETLYRGENGNDYIYDQIDSPGYQPSASHMDYLASCIADATSVPNRVGIIAEGNWWVAEASTIFDQLADAYGEEYSKQNRNFAFMPLPKADDYVADETTTMYDHLSALMFVKKNVAENKKEVISDFVKFVNTDASLESFSVITNTMKALNYTISAEGLAKMNYYGRSLYNLQRKCDIVYPYNGTKFFADNSTFFKEGNQYYSKLNNINNQYVHNAYKNGYHAEAYFQGMAVYYEEDWSNRR